MLHLGITEASSPVFQHLYKLSFNLQRYFDTDRERKEVLKILSPYTHVNYKRLQFLWNAAETCAQLGIKGGFVETGVWRGGCAGILSYSAKKYGYKNSLYFFDSFEGLPQPNIKDGFDAKVFANNTNVGKLKPIYKIKAEEKYIHELLFDRLDIDAKKVHIVKGWFQNTLPIYKNKIQSIAILRLDGDWYESTKVALDNLYELVVRGGYVIIDDYFFWDGCRKAVDEFIQENNLSVVIKKQDASGAYFIKTN